ncbi:nitroreductase family protein [Actinophytocola sp.]|uniref:nitroreductase family protein n=1 Tax=Actinophytocola sp. TaxID=1872138 RepID=UPI002EDA75FD
MLDAETVLTTTRAVRRRLDLDRPVPLWRVMDCLRVAQQAPTGSGTTHWIVVTDRAVLAEIARMYRSAFQERHGGHPEVSIVDDVKRWCLSSAAYLAQHLDEVPVVVLACVDTGGPLPEGNQASLWGSVLPAAWSYMLAARSRGLGTAWTTLHLGHEREVADLLDIPAGVHQAVLIPTAYYLGTTFGPARRPPLHTTVHQDHW